MASKLIFFCRYYIQFYKKILHEQYRIIFKFVIIIHYINTKPYLFHSGVSKGVLPTSPSCKIKTELSNVTFIEGINSGNFTDMGHVSTFDQCKQKCCDNERCNIAFKIQDDCYGVACYSRQSCRTRPAKNANVFTPEMALMRSVQESLEQSKYSCYLYLFYF